MVSDNQAGDAPLSRAVADSATAGAGRRPGRHGRRSALRTAVDARLEELPFSRGVMLMVTAGLAFAVLVIGTAVALTAGGSGSEDPRSAAAAPAVSPGTTGHSPRARASHRRPRTSSSTMVGPAPSRTASPHPSTTTSGPAWWPPRDGRPHWRSTSPPPWWRHR